MAWRQATDQARRAGERRLRALAQQWRPVGEGPSRPEPTGDLHVGHARLRLSGWSGPAVRGLALLGAIIIAITAYGMWMGRPRAIAEPPSVLATGVPITPAGPTAVATTSGGASRAPLPGAAPTATAPVTSIPDAGSQAASTPSVPELVVHVIGFVRRPGIVRLPVGARVVDALDAVGGVTRRRAADSVNLARLLVDGEQVVVDDHGPAPGAAQVAAGGAAAPPGSPTVAIVDLNSATVSDLDTLPGIGPVIAARIVAWRTENGRFRSVEELGEVSGIGESILTQVRALVRV